jgi:hypothetical protein
VKVERSILWKRTGGNERFSVSIGYWDEIREEHQARDIDVRRLGRRASASARAM